MSRRELAFRLLAAAALGCHAFFHGIWIAGFLLRPGCASSWRTQA